jgi:hypothetical protein
VISRRYWFNRLCHCCPRYAWIVTIAGGGSTDWSEGLSATQIRLNQPRHVAADLEGNIYFDDIFVVDPISFRAFPGRIYRLTSNGVLSVIAGNGTVTQPTDGIPAAAMKLESNSGLATDSIGNVYFTDSRLLLRMGVDGLLKVMASLESGSELAVDSMDNVYYNSSDGVIRLNTDGTRTVFRFRTVVWVPRCNTELPFRICSSGPRMLSLEMDSGGQLASQPTATAETFRLAFKFQADALPSAPPLSQVISSLRPPPAPLYTSLTPGYPGLYQINFVVPGCPPGCLRVLPDKDQVWSTRI